MSKKSKQSHAIMHLIRTETQPNIWLVWFKMLPEIDWSERSGEQSLAAEFMRVIGKRVFASLTTQRDGLVSKWLEVWSIIMKDSENWPKDVWAEVIREASSAILHIGENNLLKFTPIERWKMLADEDINFCLNEIVKNQAVEILKAIMDLDTAKATMTKCGSELIDVSGGEAIAVLLACGAVPWQSTINRWIE